MSTATEAIAPGCIAVEKLGGGPLFEVWKVRDERHGLAVCKMPRPDTERSRALRRLRREAGLLQSLSHRAIPRLLDAQLDAARPRLLIEYLPGPNLGQRLRRGPLDPVATARLGADIAHALDHLSSLSLVHLDVKPANVVLGSGAWLVDFSLARPLARARSIVLPVGTRGYMAPEVCRAGAPGKIGNAADVWGLGATLYEALTGTGPGQVPQRPRAPGQLADTILACLRRDPKQRPHAGEVAAALRAFAATPAAA